VKGIIKQILLTTCVIGATTYEALGAPFNFNPQSFQNYMNTVKWDDGSKASFQNLNTCVKWGEAPDFAYRCFSGYATISNPMGTTICKLTTVYWNPLLGIGYATKNCRYK
jgi:hypothetical protein